MCMYSELPGYPMVRTGHFHCCGLDSVSGQELRSCKAQDMTPPPKKKKNKKTSIYIIYTVWLLVTSDHNCGTYQ